MRTKPRLRVWSLTPGSFRSRPFRFPRWRTSPKLRRMFKPSDLFDLGQTEHAGLFKGCEYAWEALKRLKDYLTANLRPALHNRCEGTAYIGEQVFIGQGTVVEDGAMIKGPAIIGCNCQIRHNAYLREDVIVGDNCVVGNSSELKNVLMFNDCQAPHFNYVGDSILGHKTHLGAGVKVSNIKLDGANVFVEMDGKPFDTGLRTLRTRTSGGSQLGCTALPT